MEDLEVKCVSSLPFQLPLYVRYVDDILTAVPPEQIDRVLHTFNSVHERLQFTVEKEESAHISFLDTSLTRGRDQIWTNWWHKDTCSYRYMNFNSYQPITYKIGVILGLVDKAIKLSSPEFYENNLKLMKNVLEQNDYPTAFIDKHIKSRLSALQNAVSDAVADNIEENMVNYITIPYIEGLFESLNKNFAKYNIKFVAKTHLSLSALFDSGKDITPLGKTSEVVYSIPCKDCNEVYIGQTGRPLATRIKEHIHNIKEPDNKQTALTQHITELDHRFDYDNTEILKNESNYQKRRIHEMLNIITNKSVNFRKDTENLSVIYNSLLKK